MPIQYEIKNEGHFIEAIATGLVTSSEFVAYEIDHAIDKRVKAPVFELLEIQYNALKNIQKIDIFEVLSQRKQKERLPVPHRCAIVVSVSDIHGWDLAKFYEGMVNLHSPESVIVFGDKYIALTWLDIKNR